MIMLHLSRRAENLREGRVDVYHIGEFADGGVFAHQDADLLNDVGSMGAIGVTT
jgi:hypothetical protein